jgi:glycosyltransferase involved in cell wall biosynthesis/SAM-dependent methyltransferase
MNARPCWCGCADLVPFSPDYLRCPRCETLVLQSETSAVAGRVDDDARDFYGRDYWFGHMRELGHPDIRERSRRDLSERCLHWLRTVLRYCQPPARTLELGCGHGGFVAMLRSVGFDACGLELSPSIAEFATRTFGVPVLTGPVEDQAMGPGSMDLVLAMDVLEHLSDPLATVRHCAGLLARAGLFILQTPCYPEGMSFGDMQAHRSPFLEQLRSKGQEHIYLFSRTSVRALFERVGLGHVAFEPAMFAHYDMLVVASRAPLTPRPEIEAVATLAGAHTTGTRLVLALLDLDRDHRAMAERLTRAENDAAARLQNTLSLGAMLAEADADRKARLEQVQTLDALVHHILREREQEGVVKQQLEQLFETARDMLVAARAEIEARRTSAAGRPEPEAPGPARGRRRRKRPPERPLVAIDVTPVLPGSENGGAKRLVLALLDELAARGRHRYVLLTTPSNHDGFAGFERDGMKRSCLAGGAAGQVTGHGVLERLWRPRGRRITRPLGAQGVKLLFCPMTDPAHVELGTPTVCTVYDLQHLEYPDFFTVDERVNRDAFLNRVKNVASLVVCISEFTRREVIGRLGLAPERVRAIPVAIHHRLVPPSAEAVRQMRSRFGLGDAPYALYPANGWLHKNHQLLLVGFAQLLADRPELPLHLVLAGNLLGLGPGLQEAVTRMNLARRVHLVGFVSDEELAQLLRGAFCLLFPSLYEGFGIPLLEAMQSGTPIVCSRAASLPEVGGGAARYIDPRRPGDIGVALQELYDQPELRRALIERGGRRLEEFRSADMVDRYLDVLDEVLGGGGHAPAASVEGVFGDRWLGPVVTALAGASPRGRVWDFEMSLPDWYPHAAATVRADLDGRKVGTLQFARGQTRRLQVNVPPAGGQVRLEVAPSFVPNANGDHRELTVQLVRCQLRESGTGTVIHEV